MRGREWCVLPVVVFSLAVLLVAPAPAWAYVGPGPGMEMIPTFFSLLTWVGVAVGAVLLWPADALVRRLRGGRRKGDGVTEGTSANAGRV
jgi:hypothetical protein